MNSEQLRSLRRTIASYPWGLWWKQLRRIMIVDAKRHLFTWRAGYIYFLAYAPVAIIGLHVLVGKASPSSLPDDTNALAGIIQFYYIRLGIFFGCLGIFSRLIHGEMAERTLHYYLLSPVRREIVLLGKFAAGMLSAVLLYGTAVLLCFSLTYKRFGSYGEDFVLHGPGLGQLEAYLAVTVLACLGYGSVFLLLGTLLKNPAPAAMLVMGWEAINPILPSLLQKISIASYLRHLMPFTVPGIGIFSLLSVITEPVRPWAAALGIVVLTGGVLVIACYRMRSLEIRYGNN